MSTADTVITLKDYLPLLGVIVGGVLTLLAGYISPFLIERRRNASESKKLAFAFKGELLAIASIGKRRRYVEYIKSLIERMEQNKEPVLLQIQVHREYFNVFNSNVGNIGTLKNPLPEIVPRQH